MNIKELKKKTVIDAAKTKQLKVFIDFFYPQRVSFIVGMTCILISSGLQLVIISFLGKLIDISMKSSSQVFISSIRNVIYFLIIAVFIKSVLSFLQQYSFLLMNENSTSGIRKVLYDRYLRFRISFFDKERVGDLLSRINTDIYMLQNIFADQLPVFLYQSITAIISLVMLFAIDVKLTILMLITFPITTILSLQIGKSVRSLSKEIQDSYALSHIYLEETLQKIRTVKVFANEDVESERYSSLLNRIIKKSINRAIRKSTLDNFSTVVTSEAVILILWYGTTLVSSDRISVGNLISFMMITTYFGSAISTLGSAYANFQNSLGSTERLYELLTTEVEQEKDAGSEKLYTLNNEFLIKDVHFSYDKNKVLDGLNFSIKKGEKIGIVGASGTGKSTLTQLLLRFYEPDSGHIYIDGVEINSLHLSSYRRLFGVVSQEIELYGSTIKENICYGKPDATMAMMIDAAKRSFSYDFIKDMPNGFDTVVGENGITLSGGQRQRIAIARALLIDPSVLILDEATSALDSATESLIKEALTNLTTDRTTIMIAHRLASIRNMDKIIVLQNGSIVEIDTHDNLINIPNGVYKEMISKQSTGKILI